MEVFVLVPNPDRELDDLPDPWEPWYDKCFKQIVRAENEEAARKKAQESAGHETNVSPVHHDVEERIRDREVWTDENLVKCVPIEEYESDNFEWVSDDVICRSVHHA